MHERKLKRHNHSCLAIAKQRDLMVAERSSGIWRGKEGWGLGSHDPPKKFTGYGGKIKRTGTHETR